MTGEFQGPRTAIVTGGAKRIGAALARALSADGWHLLIHCNRSVAEAEALAAELQNAAVISAELAEPDAANRIFAAAQGLPPVRLLVNNASRFAYDSADDFSVAVWDAHQAINLRAPALLSQAFAKIITSVLPNFANFDVKNPIINPGSVIENESVYYMKTIAYGVVYALVLIIGGILVFDRREV